MREAVSLRPRPPRPRPGPAHPAGPRTLVLLVFCQAFHTGHEDVVVAQELSQQQAAEAVPEALVPRGVCGQDRDRGVHLARPPPAPVVVEARGRPDLHLWEWRSPRPPPTRAVMCVTAPEEESRDEAWEASLSWRARAGPPGPGSECFWVTPPPEPHSAGDTHPG